MLAVILSGTIYLGIKLFFGNWIYPAVFVISNKSLNRSKKRSGSRFVIVDDMP